MADTHHRGRGRINPWWWVLSGGGAFVAIIALVAWFGGNPAPDGTPWLDQPDAVILAIIGGVVTMLTPIIPALAGIRRETSATAHHVVNDHGNKNLREDIDEIKAIAHRLDARVSGVQRDVGRMDERLNVVLERQDYQQKRTDDALQRIHNLERPKDYP